MTQVNPSMPQTLGTSPLSNTAGNVFCMTVDSAHSHQNSSGQSSVSTLRTFIDEIALQDKITKKQKKIVKSQKKVVAYWSKQEISTLVELLRKYGSDFTMIATQMTKSRDQIKRKFKVLQKKNSKLADAIFEKEISSQTLKAIAEQMEIEENDFFGV